MYLAQYVNTPIYVVHVMSKGAAAEIAAAKLRGQRVIGETIASGIAAEEGKIWDPDFKVCRQHTVHDQELKPLHHRDIAPMRHCLDCSHSPCVRVHCRLTDSGSAMSF